MHNVAKAIAAAAAAAATAGDDCDDDVADVPCHYHYLDNQLTLFLHRQVLLEQLILVIVQNIQSLMLFS